MAAAAAIKENPIRLILIEDHADFRESVSMVPSLSMKAKAGESSMAKDAEACVNKAGTKEAVHRVPSLS